MYIEFISRYGIVYNRPSTTTLGVLMSHLRNFDSPDHEAYIRSLDPGQRLLHDIFCACRDVSEDAEDGHSPHGPSSLRHPYTDAELEDMGYAIGE